MIKVTILSPNHALRVGLREMLNAQPGFEVVGEVREPEEIIPRETEVLVLASVSPDRASGIRTDTYGILLLTDNPEDIRSMMQANPRAWGVVSTGTTSDELAAAVRAVGEGLWVGAPVLVQGMMRAGRSRDAAGEELLIEPLTAREKEVLHLMAEGLANKQIAMQLGISEHTVKFHLSSIYGKLNVASRTEAVKRGLGLGLISL